MGGETLGAAPGGATRPGRAGAMRAKVEICIRESWEHRLSPFCAGSLGRARSATERGRDGCGGYGRGCVRGTFT